MENPAPRARAHIECTDRARTAEATEDERVLVDYAGRVEASDVRIIAHRAGGEREHAFVGEALDQAARLRIKGEEEITGCGEEAALAAGFVLPPHEAALPSTAGAGARRGGIPFPQLAAGRGIERDHDAI